jgi:diguanylate cyclase (GGDEF)-like protein
MNELSRAVTQIGLETLFGHIHAIILLVGPDGNLIAWNRAFDLVRRAFPEANSLQDYVPPEEQEDLALRLAAAKQNGGQNRGRFSLIAGPDGGRSSFDCLFAPLARGRTLVIAEQIATDPVVAEAIEKLNRQVKMFHMESKRAKMHAVNKQIELEAVIAQAHEVSNMDELTLLPNRRQVLRELQNEALRAQRYDTPLSISIADVDHFKVINDTYGHLVGDHVLREIAVRLRDHIRHPDVVARYGGEEFLILLPNTSLQSASEQASRLCREVRDSSIQVDDQEIHVTISIGVAQFQNGVDTWQTLLSRADTAMYEAKRRGRDQWAAGD